MEYNIRKRNPATGDVLWLTVSGWQASRKGAIIVPADQLRSLVSDLLTGVVEPGVWIEWPEVNTSGDRELFALWVEHPGEDEHELMLPAEVITDELAATLKPLSRWGVNEKNLRHGMQHWHWTIPNENLPQVRACLLGLGLIETDDLHEVW